MKDLCLIQYPLLSLIVIFILNSHGLNTSIILPLWVPGVALPYLQSHSSY